jgi:5-methyltetrahydrofolate--homocysteine methyltransferase
MILIGELLNSTRKKVRAAIEGRDAEAVQELARRQAEAGAAFIDLNTGALLDRELECMEWLIRTVREVADRPLSIDSPDPEALALGCELGGPGTMINSISAETARYEKVLPLVLKYKAPVIALGMDDEGLPEDEDRGFDVLEDLIDRLEHDGVTRPQIFADPLVRPVGANTAIPRTVLKVISRLRLAYPDLHVSGGVSNVSHGLPCRRLINRAFMTMAMAAGLDAAIVDPLDAALMAEIAAAELLLGRDEFAMHYISLFRSGRLEAEA